MENNGYSEDQISDALGSLDGKKGGGIDLNRPVEVSSFPPPEKMTQYKLAVSARSAIDQIDYHENQYGADDSLKSIRKQMEFIYENAESGVDPLSQLGDRTLSYAIIASRELASPEELKITEKLNQVSSILDGMDN